MYGRLFRFLLLEGLNYDELRVQPFSPSCNAISRALAPSISANQKFLLNVTLDRSTLATADDDDRQCFDWDRFASAKISGERNAM
jgi:hypothetical protein